MSEILPVPFPVGFDVVRQGLEPDARRYLMGNCSILVGTMPGDLMHLSIARQDRYPSWDEIREARYALLPHDRDFALYLPPPSEYVNVHNNCFHLHECVCHQGRR